MAWNIILILLSITVGTVILYSIWYLLRMRKELGEMRPLQTGKITQDVYALKDDSYINMYIIKSDHGYIAIDTGLHPKTIRRELDSLGISPQEVHTVLITHSDYDHVQAAALFKDATIYMPAAEVQMINGTQPRAAFFYKNSLKCDYKTLEPDQILEIDRVRVKCIHTPGHTPGSMCYIVNDKYLFTGDTIRLEQGKVELSSEFFNMDSAEASLSISQLSRIPEVQYIFTAHFGYTDDPAGAFAEWKDR